MRDLSPLLNDKVCGFLDSSLHCGVDGYLVIFDAQKRRHSQITLHHGQITHVEKFHSTDDPFELTALIDILSLPGATYDLTQTETESLPPRFPSIVHIEELTQWLQQSLTHQNLTVDTCKQLIDMRQALLPFSLVCSHPAGNNFEYSIESSTVRFGSGSEVDIQLEDRSVSETHSELNINDNGLWLSDLGSEKGTRLNDHYIPAFDLVPYSFTDVFHIGRYRFEPTTETILQASILRVLAKRELNMLNRKGQVISNLDLQSIIDKYKKDKAGSAEKTTITEKATQPAAK